MTRGTVKAGQNIETEMQAQMDFSDQQAEHYGVPPDIEEWRFELVMALRDPAAYAAALRTVGNLDLYCSFARLEWINRGAVICIEHFVPEKMANDFFDGLDELRGLALFEASARSLCLHPRGTPWQI